MKHLITIAAILIFSFSSIFSQNSTKIINAFKNSYKLEREGKFKNAADELKKVYSDDSYEINLRIGWLLYNAGLFDQSAAHYQKAINLKPYSEEAKFGLAYPKTAQGKWKEVTNIYNKILEINPKNTVANYKLGLIYYGKKEYTTAQKYFKLVLSLYPFDHDALLMSAWTYYFLGKTNSAKILFNKVLMNNPNDASAKEGLRYVK
ncbi:MAG: tetratricopeptide repeat protein [Chlorobi bacterium]|nr:tetratricopeptide repeat protein [Chlorobiota bacterium]